MFTPKHPTTKPKVERVIRSESVLDIESLIDEAVAGVETIVVRPE